MPRAWALTWLAGAHREPPDRIPEAWRDRWAAEASSFGAPGMPERFLDEPNAGVAMGGPQRVGEERSLATLERVRAVSLPRLVREAEDRAWWSPRLAWAGRALVDAVGDGASGAGASGADPTPDPGIAPTVRAVTAAELDGLALAPRVIPPFDAGEALGLLRAAALDGARVVVAASGPVIVGVAVAAPSATEAAVESLLALGVAPAFRGEGLGRALLRMLVEGRPPRTPMEARVGVAERDVVEPAHADERLAVARRLLEGAGFEVRATPPDAARDDPRTLVARLRGG